MNPDDPEAGEDRFSELLAAYDEALATGQPPEAPTLPPELAERVAQAAACLRRLEQHRRGGPEPARTPPLEVTPVDGLSLDGQGVIAQVGRWRFLRELGRGGSGIVYLAWDPLLHREVAVKVPRPEVLLTPELRRRFLREAQSAAGFEHPNLVPVYEAGEVGPFCYIVSAYCQGTTLGTWLKQQQGFVAPRAAASHLAALTNAVAYIHGRGVLHRDIKPNNILLTAPQATAEESSATDYGLRTTDALSLVPKLTDFGLAKQTQELGEETKSGTLLGTPLYMAPEQAEGRVRDIGPHTDVYALGVVLYELLTGRPPFLGETDWAVRKQIATAEPVPPRRLRLDVPRDLETICLKCLQKDPVKRYASAAALSDDLRRFLEGRPIQARQVGGGEKLWRWCQRNPMVASLTTVVAISLLAGTGISAYFAIQAVQRADDLRKQLYISNVNRALGEGQNNNVSLAERLLDACPEDLRGWEWRYARRFCYQDPVTIYAYFTARGRTIYNFTAHHTVAFSPDSQWVAAMDCDFLLKLYDTATGTHVRTMQGETGLAFSVAISPDGKWVATGNADHAVRIWNTQTGKLVHTLRGPSFVVYFVHFLPDGKRILSASPILADHHEWLSRMEILTWDVTTGRQLSRKVVADANIIWGNVAFSPDGSQFAAPGNPECRDLGPSIVGYLGSALGQGPFLAAAVLRPGKQGTESILKLGNADSGQCTQTIYTENVTAFAFRPDGKVAATSWAEKMGLWDAGTGKGIRSLQGHTGPVQTLAFSPDGSQLASGSEDNSVRLWDTSTGKELVCFRGHTDRIQSVAFSPNGRWIASAGIDGTVRLWDAVHGAVPLNLHAQEGMWLSDVKFSPNGRKLYSFAGHSTTGTPEGIRVWDLENPKQTVVLPGSEGWLTCMDVSADGKRIASSDKDGHITLWDASTGLRDRWAAVSGTVHSLAFSPDGKELAYAIGNEVMVIDPENRRDITTLHGSNSPLQSLTFSPDSRAIAAAAQDRVLVWQRTNGQILCSFAANTYDTRIWHMGRLLAFSPEGKLAAADRNRISIRDPLTGREILSLPGHSGHVLCLAFSPDGKRLASGSQTEYEVKLWDTTTGQEMAALRGHTNYILSLAFSPDGERLASSSVDGTVKLWSATAVPPERTYLRMAHDWAQASVDNASSIEDQPAVLDPQNLSEPVRSIAIPMARHRADNLGRIPAFCSAVGNDFWRNKWSGFIWRRYTEAVDGFRKNLALNPDKASAHADFAFFLLTCPEPQFRDAAKGFAHAQVAVALEPADADFAAVLGMAQYRTREWQAAVDTLEKAIERSPARYLSHAKLILSMAHQQLGHATEAHRWYQQAFAEIKKDGSREELDHLRVEAAAVLRISNSTPATETNRASP
jgi:WD40 repeat protein/serine/threonine protein kinase